MKYTTILKPSLTPAALFKTFAGRWTDGRMDVLVDGQMDEQADERTDGSGQFRVTSYKKGLKNVFLKIWVNVLLKSINLRFENSIKMTHY